jgi:hypothetical protein
MKAKKIECINLDLSFDEYGIIDVVLAMFIENDLNKQVSDTHIAFTGDQIDQLKLLSKQMRDFKDSTGFLSLDDN